MATVEFNFTQANSWNMGPACGTNVTPSVNPAPTTTHCIYILHNSNENSTYVGYADNASHRWSTRYEVFHIIGVPTNYAQNVLCAYCMPTVSKGNSMFLEGRNNLEHLLIRAVVNGLLGRTTSTNTQLGQQACINSIPTKIRVYLPSEKWGKLQGRKQIDIDPRYGY